MTNLPQFSRALLHPRYWGIWFGIGLLYLITLLPYPVIYRIGCGLGHLAMRFMKRRVRITRRNIELAFPHVTPEKREYYLKKNFESVGMGLMETGIAWFWPTWRIRRWCDVSGVDQIHAVQEAKRGVLLIGIHFLTLELGARMFGMNTPGIGVYRPNDNPLLDWLQTWGRMRSNKSMIDRKDLKGMIRALKQGEIIWYAPDHDYGPRASVFVPFFAVDKAATTTGTYLLARMGKPAIIPFTPRRLEGGKGYEMIIHPQVADFPLDDEVVAATYMNKVVENEIRQAPEQYMWLHRRFKTRPQGESSLYKKLKD